MTHTETRDPAARLLAAALLAATALSAATAARADEGGVPFWLSGQMPSLAATPPSPGFSLAVVGYNYSGDASASKSFQIGGTVVGSVKTDASLALFQLGYAPDTTLFGGQPSIGLAWGPGTNKTTATVTLAGTGLKLSRTDTITGGTDFYPTANIFWNRGNSNWMVYATADLPAGTYSASSFANLGIGHAAGDLGGGYTYLDPKKGHEFTAVAGVTFNAENGATNYTNGTDAHLDWAASQFLSEHWQIGIVGYVYDQLSGDGGSGDRLGSFESHVAAAGPEVGYVFAVGQRAAYFNVRGYWEFWAQNRVEGRALYATLSVPLGASPKR
jgi:hypothetical protein